ncbi:MAG: PAS domain-containing sensor histidine kinase [Gammaproteobacteria bacterium]|nr:MAG: PAS domain-containing sensor histidine kinase [Gammaproteobacteria bacterium]
MKSTPYRKFELWRDAWRAFLVFNGFRVFVPLAIAAVYFTPLRPVFLGAQAPTLFPVILFIYLLVNLLLFAILPRWKQSLANIVLLAAGIDVVGVTLMTHASGGVSSGLGALLIVTCAGVGLLLPTRIALTIAAIASVAILGEHTLRVLNQAGAADQYIQAGILGGIYFFATITASMLARQTVESERRARERARALERMRKLNEHVLRYMETGVLVIDARGCIEQHNRAAWRFLGMPEKIRGRRLNHISPNLAKALSNYKRDPQYEPPPLKATTTGPLLDVTFRRVLEHKETVIVFLEDRAKITQTAQNLKLASLGRLTASIAHELRNPLGAVSHAAQLLAEGQQLGAEEKELISIILNHTERMNSIIVSILELSQRKEARIDDVDLTKLLPRFVQEYQLAQKNSPVIELDIDKPSIPIRFDKGQLFQLLTNLCDNAIRHSAEHTGRPYVHIFAGVAYHSGDPYLEVLDEGPGIKPELRDYIFEPFFTTSAKGSGLGLYLSRELCEANGARIEYVASPKGGACFRIYFQAGNNKNLS